MVLILTPYPPHGSCTGGVLMVSGHFGMGSEIHTRIMHLFFHAIARR